MRCFVCLLLGGLLVAGCAGSKPKPNSPTYGSSYRSSTNQATKVKVIITPDMSPEGKVVRVNNDGRYVVVNFPVGAVPPIGQFLNAYRQGLKVGELKVSGPQDDENTIADITNGNVRSGDEVRGD